MINSVVTIAPRMGETNSASLMSTLMSSYSRMRSATVNIMRNSKTLFPKSSEYENSSLTIRKRATSIHATKKCLLFQSIALTILT